MNLLLFIIASLATYRLSRMMAIEDGPGDLFVRFRTWVWKIGRGRRDGLYKGLACPLCLSFWIGAGIALILPWNTPTEYALTTLALSGAAVFLYRQERNDERN